MPSLWKRNSNKEKEKGGKRREEVKGGQKEGRREGNIRQIPGERGKRRGMLEKKRWWWESTDGGGAKVKAGRQWRKGENYASITKKKE